MDATESVLIAVLLYVALPVVVGAGLSKVLGDAAKRRGWPLARVRTLRLVLSLIGVTLAIAGATETLQSYSFLSALTISAVAGVAITLALQTTLQNILAGFVLLQRRFLHVGDAVQFGGVKGTVVSIGLVEVILRTDDGALAFVSTSNMLAGPTLNFTAAARLSGEY